MCLCPALVIQIVDTKKNTLLLYMTIRNHILWWIKRVSYSSYAITIGCDVFYVKLSPLGKP